LEGKDIYLSFKNKKFRKKLISVIEKFNPDIIHCQFGYEALMLLDNYFNPNKKFVISFMGYDASAKLKLNVYRKKIGHYLSFKNVFPIYCSKYLKNNLIINNIKFNKEHLVLYFGTNTEFFKRKSYNRSRKLLIFLQVSSFKEKKGHLYTLTAFKKFLDNNPNVHFNLVLTGRVDEFKEYKIIKKLTIDLGLENIVKFVGWVTPEETKELFEKAHFFVQHSITASDGDQEGMPNSIMEAMAMELPVISTYNSGIIELVEDGVNGYLVNEKDIENYAIKINDIIHWGYLKLNRDKIIESFEIGKHIDTLLNFYNKII